MMDHTVTTLGVEDGLTKKAAIESSRHKYAVMEREKFYFNESYKFTQLDELDGIITDEFPDQSRAGYAGFPWCNALLRNGSSGMQQQSDKTGGHGNNL